MRGMGSLIAKFLMGEVGPTKCFCEAHTSVCLLHQVQTTSAQIAGVCTCLTGSFFSPGNRGVLFGC